MILKSTVQYDYPEEVVTFNAFRAAGFSSCWRKLAKRSWSQGGQKERLNWSLSIGVYISL